MHKHNLVFIIGLFVLPLKAQTNRALPEAPLSSTQLAPPAIPPNYYNPALAQSPATVPSGRTLYRWSVAAILAANAADAATSWKTQEANPVIAGPGNQFGVTSVAIKSGFVVTSLLIEHIVLRHRPDLYKRLAWMNLITSGAFGAVATYNVGVR